MDQHEFERLPATARRTGGNEQQAESAPPLTTESAVLNLQRAAGNESVSALLSQEPEEASPVREVVGSGAGSPLQPGTRSFLEDGMGADFSDVRVHTGPKADESARSIGAQAYTVGTDVVFGSGVYQPETSAGQHVLAHELAHVVQQKAGPVAGTPAPGGISVSHPSDPFERAAERAADQVMAGQAASPVAGSVDGAATAQRAVEDDEEEAPVQALAAQREAEDELDEEAPPGS